jgi:hypothetical protein
VVVEAQRLPSLPVKRDPRGRHPRRRANSGRDLRLLLQFHFKSGQLLAKLAQFLFLRFDILHRSFFERDAGRCSFAVGSLLVLFPEYAALQGEARMVLDIPVLCHAASPTGRAYSRQDSSHRWPQDALDAFLNSFRQFSERLLAVEPRLQGGRQGFDIILACHASRPGASICPASCMALTMSRSGAGRRLQRLPAPFSPAPENRPGPDWSTDVPLAAPARPDHAPGMFCVSEADAAAIRTAYEQDGELSAAVELRRLFPGIVDNENARACVRSIAGWTPLPVQPVKPVSRRRASRPAA